MERPKAINSGEALRWNADVERRRKAYHERRCGEDPIYKRAYERRQEMYLRMQHIHNMEMAALQNAMGLEENAKCCQSISASEEEVMQKMRTHVEIMQERQALLHKMEQRRRDSHVFIDGGSALAFSTLVTLIDNPNIQQYVKELEEEIPYTEEIQKIDKEFDDELIRMSGFEW